MKKNQFTWLAISTMVLLLPFERMGTFDLAGFTIKPAYIIAGLFVVCQICLMFWRRNNLKMNQVDWLVILFAVWAFSSVFWSLNQARSLIMSALLSVLILLFVFLRRSLDDPWREKIKNMIVWLGLAVSLMALLQFFVEPIWGYKIALLRYDYSSRLFGFPRPHATFLEPLYLANFLIWPIFFKINQILKARPEHTREIKSHNFGSNLILIIMLVAFILTLSRGAYLGLLCGLFLALILAVFNKIFKLKYFLQLAGSLAIALAVSLILIYTVAGKPGLKQYFNQAVRSRDLPAQNQLEEGKNRDNTESIAIQEIKNHPVFGIGSNSFGALPQFELLRQNNDWQIVNNEYLEIWVELGIMGLILFLAIIYLAISYQLSAIRNGSYDNIVYLGAITALLVQWLTFSTIYLLYIWVFLAIVWPSTNSKIKGLSRLSPKDQISK